MTAARRGVTLSDDDRAQILGAMRTLPPHPEVPESLARLRGAGLRLAKLTNSTRQVAKAQLTNTGLIGFLQRALSADSVRRFNPAAEVYHTAAKSLGIELSGHRLVAAHIWDLTGAMRAGCAAAFIARPGMVIDPLAEPPDGVGPDLRAVAECILEVEKPAG